MEHPRYLSERKGCSGPQRDKHKSVSAAQTGIHPMSPTDIDTYIYPVGYKAAQESRYLSRKQHGQT